MSTKVIHNNKTDFNTVVFEITNDTNYNNVRIRNLVIDTNIVNVDYCTNALRWLREVKITDGKTNPYYISSSFGAQYQLCQLRIPPGFMGNVQQCVNIINKLFKDAMISILINNNIIEEDTTTNTFTMSVNATNQALYSDEYYVNMAKALTNTGDKPYVDFLTLSYDELNTGREYIVTSFDLLPVTSKPISFTNQTTDFKEKTTPTPQYQDVTTTPISLVNYSNGKTTVTTNNLRVSLYYKEISNINNQYNNYMIEVNDLWNKMGVETKFIDYSDGISSINNSIIYSIYGVYYSECIYDNKYTYNFDYTTKIDVTLDKIFYPPYAYNFHPPAALKIMLIYSKNIDELINAKDFSIDGINTIATYNLNDYINPMSSLIVDNNDENKTKFKFNKEISHISIDIQKDLQIVDTSAYIFISSTTLRYPLETGDYMLYLEYF